MMTFQGVAALKHFWQNQTKPETAKPEDPPARHRGDPLRSRIRNSRKQGKNLATSSYFSNKDNIFPLPGPMTRTTKDRLAPAESAAMPGTICAPAAVSILRGEEG
jgi:hypothetical protein